MDYDEHLRSLLPRVRWLVYGKLMMKGLLVLKHFMVKKTHQSQSIQRNYVEAPKIAITLADLGFIPFPRPWR